MIATLFIFALLLLPISGEAALAEEHRATEVIDCEVESYGPEYYRIDLVPTRNLPGIRSATGYADTIYQSSPFGVSIGNDGSYLYRLQVIFEKLRPFEGKEYAVWLTTPDLSEVERVGSLEASGEISGSVNWNKFLVVVSLEDKNSEDLARWSGPIAFRGMSRSGLMHTMAGHGPFEQEPCMAYGYQ